MQAYPGVRAFACLGGMGAWAGRRGWGRRRRRSPKRDAGLTLWLWPVCRMDKVGDALEEVLSKALSQRTITVGVYEAAKLLNV